MSFFSEWRTQLVEKFGRAAAPGPVLLPTGEEDYPVALQREIAGGAHGFESVEEMVATKRSLLTVPMLAILSNEIYVLVAMPPQDVESIAAIPNYVLEDYWVPLKTIMTFPAPTTETPDDGNDGWTMIPALVVVAGGVYMQIKDYVGGSGSKPEVGGYVGPNGIVNEVGQATNLLEKIIANLSFTAIFGYNGSGGMIDPGAAVAQAAGPAQVVNNNTTRVRSVLLLGHAVVRPDSSEEDTIRIIIQKSVDGINGWQNLSGSLLATRVNNRMQLSTHDGDILQPGAKFWYRLFCETIAGGKSHYPESPRIFFMMI